MSTYMTLAVPVALASIAAIVARSLDPDAGGVHSFGVNATPTAQPNPLPQGAQYVVSGALCDDAFVAQAQAMRAQPAALLAFITADIAARWPVDTPPALEDCQAFCSGLLIDVSGGDVWSGTAALGLQIVSA